MLGIHSFLQGVYNMLTKLTKKNYRSCAIVMAGTVVIAAVAFSSNSFGGGGKNKSTSLRNVLTSEDSSDGEETDTEAKIQAGIENVLETISDSDEFSKNQTRVYPVRLSKATQENVVEDTRDTMPKIELSSQDYNALLRIIEAEATGEDFKGKVLVGNVIMNRVKSEEFPDTVKDVVFQRVSGHVQFSPTADGRYENVTISDETKEAVNSILAGVDYSQGALFFSARDKADPSNMSWFDRNLKWLFVYGGHEFYTVK